jgi:hypothetical protein
MGGNQGEVMMWKWNRIEISNWTAVLLVKEAEGIDPKASNVVFFPMGWSEVQNLGRAIDG